MSSCWGQTDLPTQPSNSESVGHGLGHLLSVLVLVTTSLRGRLISKERETCEHCIVRNPGFRRGPPTCSHLTVCVLTFPMSFLFLLAVLSVYSVICEIHAS